MNEERDELEELGEDIIELVDDSGKVIAFKLVDVTEYKGEKYCILLPAEPSEEMPEDEVVIFRLNTAEQSLDPIEDDNLLDEIFQNYLDESDEEEAN